MRSRSFGQIAIKMNSRKDFLIPFTGLKLGKHHFDYQLDNTFLEIFDFHEFKETNLKVSLVFDKKTTFFELTFKHKGTVNVTCDLSNEEFDLPIKGKMHLIVRFGEHFNDENEELLILPHGEFQIDIAQYVYEMIVLSVPQKRVHPGIKAGTLKIESLAILNEIKTKESKKIKNPEGIQKNIDPRWDKLKQLLTDK